MFKIFKKDLRLFLKDKRAVIMTFLLPIILISLFAFAFGGMNNSNSKPSPIQLLVTDMDKSAMSKAVIAKFDSVKEIEMKEEGLEKSRDLVTKGKYIGVLVFYKGFEDSLKANKRLPVELLFDRSQEMVVGLIQPIFTNTFMKIGEHENVNRNVEGYLRSNFPAMDKNQNDKIVADMSVNLVKSEKAPERTGPVLKMTSIVGEKKENNLLLIQSIAGVAIMMLLFSVSGLASGMLDEKESGTLKRLLYSPINPTAVLFGKMITAVCLSITQLTIMFVFAWLVFGLDITINVTALVLMILSTAFAVSGIGIFLASISHTRSQAQSLSTLVVLTMSAIGGSMIPIFVMPAIMQKLAVISVNYWGIQGFYDIFWRGLPTVEILPRVFVLLGMGTLLTIVSVRLFKRNILKIA